MKHPPHSIIRASIQLLFAVLAPVAAADLKPDRSVIYKTVGNTRLHLEIFEPRDLNASDSRSAIVFFFGGGWNGGSTKQFHQQAETLSNMGMVAFCADYRVKSRNKTTPFECVTDGKSAIRWVREHAAELGVDPNKIVASGGSAGGHVAICTDLITGYEEKGENPEVSSRPNATILYNPVIDTTRKGYGAARFDADQQTTLSPCHQVKEGLAPTIVFHGTKDTTVPFENAERFTELMKKHGNECTLVPIVGKGHGSFNSLAFRPKNDKADYDLTMTRSIDFLRSHGYLENP
ncbi:alpha/beta hydrolase [Haloferula rosea]|uniref:Alpha/beta hydrolase n=1 Tax=Haloferula rosea TaxID=490093 RepID=A0A934VES3_9BACT|nr:alpha/beta hydrolase [Haloferula rosea]MBK1827629.1 alpha/beta hydrolase [Haloferula rosea]